MGSGNLFKNIISLKKGSPKKEKGSSAAVKSNGFKLKNTHKSSVDATNGSAGNHPGTLQIPIEDLAAIRIQTGFRVYKARKSLRRLKGMVRAKALTEKSPAKKQATTTLRYLHSWTQIQTQIKARRICSVTEARLKQKKLENQQKLDAKLHDIEVEWCGRPDKKEEILARIHQREEAAVKRERALAYAFSHQWRAESKYQLLGNYEIGKTSWGWSWKERWISARPWEVRAQNHLITPTKLLKDKPVGKDDTPKMNSPANRTSGLVKTHVRNG